MKYDVKLVKNGHRDYDIGKSIGIQNSSGEYIMFLDGDNILTETGWIKKIMAPLLEDSSVIGSQPLWFKFDKNDKLFDRYCTLYGITDPLTIYLDKRDRLMLWEKKWKKGLIKEEEGYFVAEFNRKDMPTIGSVGFTIQKEYFLKTNYSPSFSHLDCVQDLLAQGKNRFAMVKTDIIHLHSRSFSDFLNKLKRNFSIFIRDFDKRRYKWEAPIGKKMYAFVAITTFVIPFYHGTRGYLSLRDKAWFIHPFVCFSVGLTYAKTFFSWNIKNLLRNKS